MPVIVGAGSGFSALLPGDADQGCNPLIARQRFPGRPVERPQTIQQGDDLDPGRRRMHWQHQHLAAADAPERLARRFDFGQTQG